MSPEQAARLDHFRKLADSRPEPRAVVRIDGRDYLTWPELAPFFILLADINATLDQIRDRLAPPEGT